jgi:type VI protein secretion system component Hcp
MPIYMGIFEKENVLSRIRGDVKAKGYEGWIELQSANIAAHHAKEGRGAGREPRTPTFNRIAISKFPDSATSALLQEAAKGKGRLVVIAFLRDDGTEFMRLVLQETLIASFNIRGGGDRPYEDIELDFANVTFTTSPASPDTTHRARWDLSEYGAKGPPG